MLSALCRSGRHTLLSSKVTACLQSSNTLFTNSNGLKKLLVDQPNSFTSIQNQIRFNRLRRRLRSQEIERSNTTAQSDGGYFLYNKVPLAIGFTVLSTAAVYGGAVIWQYESYLKMNRQLAKSYLLFQKKSYQAKSKIQEVLSKLKDGEKVFCFILAANLVVFAGWRIPGLHSTMVKYFTLNLFTKPTISQMVLSTFSHQGPLHLFCNMFCLYSFINPIVNSIGKENFCALYLSSGVWACLGSLLLKTLRRSTSQSVGASGSVLGILFAFCTIYPQTQLSIIFLPFIPISAANAMLGLLAFDTAGLLLGWKFIDHAAHLGGSLFGLFYANYGYEIVNSNRGKIINCWNEYKKKVNSND